MTMFFVPHNRHSIRLPGYDYGQSGYYFVTMCTQNRFHMFGDVVDGKMIHNDAGKMVQRWWYVLANKFTNVDVDEFIVMPNHIHGIIHIVGADPRVCPDCESNHIADGRAENSTDHGRMGNSDGDGRTHGCAPTVLGTIVQWWKTMTTNTYMQNVHDSNWRPFNGRLWQRNYYEHVVRNDWDLKRIREYIKNNPSKWQKDIENNHRFLNVSQKKRRDHYDRLFTK